MSGFTDVCRLDEIAVGTTRAATIDGVDVAVVRCTGDEVFVIQDECSHAAIALSEGEVDAEACEIECWLHGSRFDLRTGKPTGLPATEPVSLYPCRVVDGVIAVDVHDPQLSESEF